MLDLPDDVTDQLRTGYNIDRELHATVIPSSRPIVSMKEGGGDSLGCDANSLGIKQNIIVCEDGNMRKVAEVTRDQLVRGAGKLVAACSAGDEQAKRRMENMGSEEEEKPMAKRRGRPPKVKNVQAAKVTAVASTEQMPISTSGYITTNTDRQQPMVISQLADPISVLISGQFGKIRQSYSYVIRDGLCLVLVIDHRQIASSYELPDAETPVTLAVTYNDITISCVWAGISFSMPDKSVTYTVLLIEDSGNEEGRNG